MSVYTFAMFSLSGGPKDAGKNAEQSSIFRRIHRDKKSSYFRGKIKKYI